MVAYLEHANLTVPDIDAAIAFLKVVEPAFTVRHDESPAGSYRWAHIGTAQCYIALQEPHVDATPQQAQRPYKDYGVNHLGWVVDDLQAVVRRLEEHGYRRGMAVAPHPYRKRAYYYDAAGFEWEIVEYLSDRPEERHSKTYIYIRGGINMRHTEKQTRLIVGTATGVCQVVSTADGAAEIIGHLTPLPHAVARLAVCQAQPQVVYLAAYEGGMWRSDDGGGTWRQLHAYPVEHAHSVVVDPHDPTAVYVGSEPAAIFHSRDGGATWQECAGFRAVPESKHWHFFAPRHAHVRDLTMAPDDAQRLYAGLEVGGVVRSTDGGQTWQQLHGPYEDVHSLSVTPARAQTLYAATARQPWRSNDGGETWTAIGAGLPHQYTVPIAAAPDDPDVVLVSCSTSFQRQTGTLTRSADGGRSWQTTSWPGPHDDMVIAIAWDTVEPHVVFAGTDAGKLYRSTDRGASWQALPVTLDSVAVGGLIVMPR